MTITLDVLHPFVSIWSIQLNGCQSGDIHVHLCIALWEKTVEVIIIFLDVAKSVSH